MRKIGSVVSSQVYSHRVTVTKMSKIAHFVAFSADGSKKSATVSTKHLSARERSYWIFPENGVVNRLFSYRL